MDNKSRSVQKSGATPTPQRGPSWPCLERPGGCGASSELGRAKTTSVVRPLISRPLRSGRRSRPSRLRGCPRRPLPVGCGLDGQGATLERGKRPGQHQRGNMAAPMPGDLATVSVDDSRWEARTPTRRPASRVAPSNQHRQYGSNHPCAPAPRRDGRCRAADQEAHTGSSLRSPGVGHLPPDSAVVTLERHVPGPSHAGLGDQQSSRTYPGGRNDVSR